MFESTFGPKLQVCNMATTNTLCSSSALLFYPCLGTILAVSVHGAPLASPDHRLKAQGSEDHNPSQVSHRMFVRYD